MERAFLGRRRNAWLAVLAALLLDVLIGAQLVDMRSSISGEAIAASIGRQPGPTHVFTPPPSAGVAIDSANASPTVAFTVSPASANEGETKTYRFSISDPGTDRVSSVTTSCGFHGIESNPSFTNTSGMFECTFPDGPETTTVTAQATGSDGAAGNEAALVVSIAKVVRR